MWRLSYSHTTFFFYLQMSMNVSPDLAETAERVKIYQEATDVNANQDSWGNIVRSVSIGIFFQNCFFLEIGCDSFKWFQLINLTSATNTINQSELETNPFAWCDRHGKILAIKSRLLLFSFSFR